MCRCGPNIGVYTQPISFIGLPVVAVSGADLPLGLPIGVPDHHPHPWREDLALRIAPRAGSIRHRPARARRSIWKG